MRNLFLGSALMLVAACHQSTIQGDYHDISTGCRSTAEAKVAATGMASSESARNAELVTVFSDCMAKRGWAVATPKRAKAPTGSAKGPTGSPAATPARAAAPAPAPAPAAQPAPANNGSAYYQSTQPVTMPAGQQPGYSIYQPAYPAPAAGTVPPAATPPAPGIPQRY